MRKKDLTNPPGGIAQRAKALNARLRPQLKRHRAEMKQGLRMCSDVKLALREYERCRAAEPPSGGDAE